MMKIFNILLLFTCITIGAFAQGGPGGGRQFDPAKLVADEKQLLLDSISGLNDDQKIIIDAVYTDYEAAFVQGRENMDPNNREAMRESMMKIRDEKNDALKAVLTEEQYKSFVEMLERRREQARQGRRRPRNE